MTLNNDSLTSADTSTSTSSAQRQYIPSVGTRVKLRRWADYSRFNMPMWSWFTVRTTHETDSEGNRHIGLEHYNAGNTGEYVTVPASHIDPPLGWAPRYTIYCKPEEVSKVAQWFSRGIVVRASHDLGNAGTKAFQPMTIEGENPASPHWQYVEVTDAVAAEECGKVFRVVSVETEEVSLEHDPECDRCKGTGRDTVARLASARRQTIPETLATCQFTDYHDYNAELGTYACHCNLTLHDLGRTKRAKAIKAMVAEGWSVMYRVYAGGFWERQKETVVRDWEL